MTPRGKTHMHGPAGADRIVATKQCTFVVLTDATALNRRHNVVAFILDRKYASPPVDFASFCTFLLDHHEPLNFMPACRFVNLFTAFHASSERACKSRAPVFFSQLPIVGALTPRSFANSLCDMPNLARNPATALPVTGLILRADRGTARTAVLRGAGVLMCAGHGTRLKSEPSVSMIHSIWQVLDPARWRRRV